MPEQQFKAPNKNKAQSAFLAQANHFARLAKPTGRDSNPLLKSLADLFSAHTQKPIQIKFDWYEPEPILVVMQPSAPEEQWGVNLPEEPDSESWYACKSAWEALSIAELAREDFKHRFPGTEYYLSIYAHVWREEFGDYHKNLAESYETELMQGFVHKTNKWQVERIGYADQNLNIFSLKDYYKAANEGVNLRAHYSVYAQTCDFPVEVNVDLLKQWRDDLDGLIATAEGSRPEHFDIKDRPIELLGLGVRATLALVRNELTDIGMLVNLTESELLNIKGLGQKSAQEIITALDGYGLKLKEDSHA